MKQPATPQLIKSLKTISALAIMLVLLACNSFTSLTHGNAAPNDTAVAGSASHADYVIQPGDVLEVSVWKEKDLQREVLVRPDGGINFPLVGEMVASGKTLEQLRTELTARLNKYVPDPVVNISVKQSSGNKIYVVGKVNRPGEFVAVRNMDVMQALSMAGGPTPFAAVNKIKILRRDEKGEQTVFTFQFSHVEKGEDLEQNIILQGGDVVVVP